MNRRSFLKAGLAAGATASLQRVLFLPDVAAHTNGHAQLSAQMIWCEEQVPVPVLQVGKAVGIASSSPGHALTKNVDQHAVFIREFDLDAVPASASIRLFSYTRYRLYVNGTCAGRGPSRFQNQRPEYDTREIGGKLRPGKNTVAVLVHCDAPTGRIMRHAPGFAAMIALGEESGAATIASDASWRTRPDLSFGPREEAWASIQEHIDARKGSDWSAPGFSAAQWPAAVPVGGPEFFPVWPRTTPLQIEKRRSWSAVSGPLPFTLNPGQELVLTLPEIVQGYHSLELDAEEGSEVEASYLLPEGRSSGASSYIARAGVQAWMGGDTFAFKQLALRLKSGRVVMRRAEAVEMRYPFERAASFECDDDFLNRLWLICARSLEVLSEDAYVDCADRERVEWTDNSPPAFDCTRVTMRGPDDGEKTYWGDSRLLEALLRRIALTQQPDGQMKAHSCSERWDLHAIMEDRSCDWVVQLREYCESSADLALARELWTPLTRLMRWFLDRRTPRGLTLAREWEVWDNPLRYQVCEGAGLNALFYRALCDAAWLGRQIGEVEQASRYEASASQLRQDFNRELWNEQAGAYDGALFGPGSKTATQLNGKMFQGPIVNGRFHPVVQAELLALYAGIVPHERVDSVRRYVLEHAQDVTSVMSHYYLFDALYKMQKPEMDAAVISRLRTSWKAQVESPWQTTWEDLPGGGSKVHIYGTVPGAFLTAYVLGVRRRGAVSAKSIVIEPRCGGLRWAKGTAVTEFGPVAVDWKTLEDESFELNLDCPSGCNAVVRLYHRGTGASLTLDGAIRRGQRRGNFLELAITPGKHTVRL
jgi:alpha-L-rhamnosidase